MLSKDKIQVWANVPKAIKQRLDVLRQIDSVLYSESRVIWQCIDAHLPTVEANAHPFSGPAHETPSPRRRRRVTA